LGTGKGTADDSGRPFHSLKNVLIKGWLRRIVEEKMAGGRQGCAPFFSVVSRRMVRDPVFT